MLHRFTTNLNEEAGIRLFSTNLI